MCIYALKEILENHRSYNGSMFIRAGTNTPSDEYDTYREYRVANTIRIANTLFSEAKQGNG